LSLAEHPKNRRNSRIRGRRIKDSVYGSPCFVGGQSFVLRSCHSVPPWSHCCVWRSTRSGAWGSGDELAGGYQSLLPHEATPTGITGQAAGGSVMNRHPSRVVHAK
jgi:hypothetical protein